jgi:hypothetical protein
LQASNCNEMQAIVTLAPRLSPRGAFNGGGINPLLQLHPKNFKSLLGEVRRGSFNPFDLTAEILRFAQDDTSCRLGRGTLPLPNIGRSLTKALRDDKQ